MPIPGVPQPDSIPIRDTLCLRRYDGHADFALPWYQDNETVLLVDGIFAPYDREKLYQMYRYLDGHGELYFIEVKTPDGFLPVGDVTFWQEDMPIVIGDPVFRGRGIGKQVVSALVERGQELGYPRLFVQKIYRFNIGSQRLFEGAGFVKDKELPDGFRYRLDFQQKE